MKYASGSRSARAPAPLELGDSRQLDLERAAFLVSIDTEMAWGLQHRPDSGYRYDREREDLASLLELFDRYEVPATFATVGHLMLDRCREIDGRKHPEIVRPAYAWLDGDWFDKDPCSDHQLEPTWYAPDVVARIRAAETGHEIASHGFSHMMAGEPGCTRASFESDIRAALRVASDIGVDLRSFVYPRNQIGHVDVLIDAGIEAYRGRRPRPTRRPGMIEAVVDRTVGSERTAVRPIWEDGIVNLPATILFDLDGRRRTSALWLMQVRLRLRQAVARRSLFHVWFHPYNLRARPAETLAGLDKLLASAARHRDLGRLDTITMGQLAARLTPSD